MLENFGPIQHVALAALWWLLFFPAAGGGILAFFGARWLLDRRDDPKALPPDRKTSDRVALTTLGLTFAASVVYAYLLFQRAPADRFFVTHLLRMVRVGQLDVHFDLVLDPLASVLCIVITGVATVAAAVRVGETRRAGTAGVEPWRFHAWSILFVAGLLLAVLADGILVLIVGWHAAGVALFGLTGAGAARANVFHRAADVAFVGFAAILFWSLGGTWSDTEFTPDLNPRYVAVSSAGTAGMAKVGTVKVGSDGDDDERAPSMRAPGADAARPRGMAGPPPTGKGFVTLANTPGAIVYLDDSRTPLLAADQPLRAPFARRETPGGMHTFRIHAGDGLDDYIVPHVPVGGDADTSLVLVGPTVTFRELRDQLALENGRSEVYVRDALRSKKVLGNVSSLTLACVLLVLGIAARGALFPLHLAQVGAIAGAGQPASRMLLLGLSTTLVPTYLVARVAFLFASSPGAATWLVALGAVTALACGAAAHYTEDPNRARAFLAVGTSGVAMIALGAGAWAVAIVVALAQSLAMASLASADGLGARADRRISVAASVALLVALLAAMTTAATSEGLSRIPSVVAAAAGALAVALFSGVLARTLPGAGEEPSSKSTSPGWAPPVLGLGAVVVVVLGSSARALGSGGESVLGTWLSPVFDTARVRFDHEPAAAIGLGLVAAALSVAAWLRPRRSVGELGGFGAHAAASFHAGVAVDRGLVPLALALRALAIELERHVIDGVVHAIAVLVRAGAWVQRRVDRSVVDAPAEAVAASVEAIAANNLEAAESPRAQSTAYAVFGLLLLASVVLYVVSNR
jgi:NADH-quinone oxidoreductase subunit L